MPAIQSARSRYLVKVLLRLGILGILFVLATAIWSVVSSHTYVYTYRLETPGGAPTEAQIAQTVQVLSARAGAMRRSLGLVRASVSALPPDRVEFRLRARSEPVQALAWLTLSGRTEFRLLHPVSDILEVDGAENLPPEYEVKVYRHKQYVLSKPGDLETIEDGFAMEREPRLTVQGFEDVSIQMSGLHRLATLTFRLQPEDTETFARLTALNAGRRMAMLIDGEMFFPPATIDSTVRSGVVQVQGYYYMPPLRKLVALLNCGPLPGRLTPAEPARE